jgi:16S rRNA (adenine1518-N6/adenine1519-N6)-dimethyltransferase
LTAGPETKEYGVLSILTGLHADVTRLLALPPGAFRPPPQVSSAVVKLAFRPPTVSLKDEALFTRMVRTMFTQRRKTLTNALKAFAGSLDVEAQVALAAADIDRMRRPETLQLIELARLADVFASAVRPHVL